MYALIAALIYPLVNYVAREKKVAIQADKVFLALMLTFPIFMMVLLIIIAIP